MSPKRGGAWTKVMIFVSLYVLLLESLIEWAVVLYLYGNKSVDSKMAPSLIFSLVAVRMFPTLIKLSLIHLVVLYGASCSPTQFPRVAV